MIVTTEGYTSRLGAQQPLSIEPDEIITGTVPGWPFPTDRVASAAARWLSAQPQCRP